MANDVEIRIKATDTGADQTLSRTETSLDGLDTALDRVARRSRDTSSTMSTSSRGVERYGSGLEGLGNRADETDTRMMGLADGITGVTELTRAGSLAPAEMAMAFADLGSAAYNTVVPSLMSVKDAVGSAITKFKEGGPEADNMKNKLKGFATLGAGVAGIVGMAAAIDQVNKAVSENKMEQLVTQFQATGDAMQVVNEIGNEGFFHPFKSGADELIGTFERLLETSPQLAQSFLDQMIAQEGASATTQRLQELIDTATASQEGLTEATRSYSDTLNAMFDPMFGFIDAQTRNQEAMLAVTEAQNAYNTAVATYGATSPQATEAANALTQAQLDNAQSAMGVSSALDTLVAGLNSGDITMGQLRAQMQLWDSQGLLSQGVLQGVASKLGITVDQARALASTDPNVDVNLNDHASSPIRDIAANLGWLDGQSATTTVYQRFVRQVQDTFGWKQGGIPGAAAASGGIRGNMTLVGERGPELVKLPGGSQVIPHNSSKDMMRKGGGDQGTSNYYITIQGSVLGEREVIKYLNDIQKRGANRR